MKESLRIKPIRAFEKADIPQVADMFQRLMLSDTPSRRMLPSSELQGYFEKIFFHNPWCDDDLPSLIYQGSDGNISGFLGVVPRRMTFRGRPIRVALSFHFMVEPESRSSLAGVHILRAFFSGPQDLSLTDGAGRLGRRVWEGVGGVAVPLYSLQWTRILRPSQHAIDLLGKRKAFSPFVGALTPFSHLADAAAAKMLPRHFPQADSQHLEEVLDPHTMLEYLPQFSKSEALQPVYDDYSLQWLLNQADQMKSYGALKKVLVRDKKLEVIGWYMYYLNHGGTSTVLQLVAKKGLVNDILDHLFDHARRHGATSLYGRIEPRYMQEMSDKHCYFNCEGGWTMVHSNDKDLLHAIQRGDSFLTSLEGEWCLVF
jgi:hypothetical protein